MSNDLMELSRRQWDAVKGVLILCVVLGHSTLANVVVPALKDFVYAFHVYVFLLLPFMYGKRAMSGKSAADICIRYLVPYSVFVVACSTLRQVSAPQSIATWSYELARGLITGNDVYLKDTTGLYLFWFLPVIMWVSLLSTLYYGRAGWLKWSLLGFFVACHILLPAMSWPVKRSYPLFGTHIALYIVALGITGRFVWQVLGYRRIRQWRYSMLAGCAACFTIMFTLGSVVSLAHLGAPSYEQPGRVILHDAIPILVCLTLVGFSDVLAAVPFLAYAGQRTLPIYLMHQLCMIAFTGVYTRLIAPPQTVWGQTLLSLAGIGVALAVPLGVLYALDSAPRLKRVLFPRHVEDLVGLRMASVAA
jgi:fucose 4-O-acetylase-like acetyltransferase